MLEFSAATAHLAVDFGYYALTAIHVIIIALIILVPSDSAVLKTHFQYI